MLLGFQVEGFGVITGFMALWLGACGGAFRAWNSDRGLWMLSALFLAVTAVFFAGFAYGRVLDTIHGRGEVVGVLDLTIAGAVLWMQTRFLLTVTAVNRKLTRK